MSAQTYVGTARPCNVFVMLRRVRNSRIIIIIIIGTGITHIVCNLTLTLTHRDTFYRIIPHSKIVRSLRLHISDISRGQ